MQRVTDCHLFLHVVKYKIKLNFCFEKFAMDLHLALGNLKSWYYLQNYNLIHLILLTFFAKDVYHSKRKQKKDNDTENNCNCHPEKNIGENPAISKLISLWPIDWYTK